MSSTQITYLISKQFNGKFKVKKVVTCKGLFVKSSTIAKNKTHYEAEEFVFKIDKNIKH